MTPERYHEEGDDGGIDACYEPAYVPADDGHVEVVEAHLWEEPVEEVAWERSGETEDETEGYPLIGRPPTVHLFRETAPGDCLGVEGLETLGLAS